MDPYICCLMGLCCSENSAEQMTKLVNMRIARGGCTSEEHARKVVAFDLELVASLKDLLKRGKP